jgi:dihydroorotate dehydrogenase electron transfer subunit
MKKTIKNLKVISNKKLSDNYFLLELVDNKNFSNIKAGQFANLDIPDDKQIYLRRPFSIHDVNGNKISFLIKIIGKGTGSLAQIKTGKEISVMFPLGNGFELISKGKALLIGGGCGVAPLLLLAKQLKAKGVDNTVILGGRTKDDIVQVKEFKKYSNVKITTDNGSLGKKGFVTDLMKETADFSQIYTCGPEVMMRNVNKLAKEINIPVQASLESMMGCGIGACLCCVTETKKEGHLCVCKDGPVFNAERLPW